MDVRELDNNVTCSRKLDIELLFGVACLLLVVAGVTNKSAAASLSPSGAGSQSETRFCDDIVHCLLKPPDGSLQCLV